MPKDENLIKEIPEGWQGKWSRYACPNCPQRMIIHSNYLKCPVCGFGLPMLAIRFKRLEDIPDFVEII